MKTSTYDDMRKDRENSILLTAKELFFSKGIPYTTMKDIAAAANITRQTLYLYFKDINQLILAVQERITNEISCFDEASKDLLINLESINFIEFYINSLENLINKFQREFIFIHEADLHFKRNPVEESLYDTLNSILLSNENRVLILNQISKGQAEGVFRRDKSCEELFSIIINIAAGVTQRVLILNNRIDITGTTTPESILSNLKDMLLLFITEENPHHSAK